MKADIDFGMSHVEGPTDVAQPEPEQPLVAMKWKLVVDSKIVKWLPRRTPKISQAVETLQCRQQPGKSQRELP